MAIETVWYPEEVKIRGRFPKINDEKEPEITAKANIIKSETAVGLNSNKFLRVG